MFVLLAACVVLASLADQTPSSTQIQAPGYGQLAFEAPTPGSYQLPDLGLAANGLVLNVDGQELNLDDLMGDKLVLLSFIYSTCNDSNGCPLATAVFYRIKQRLESHSVLARQLRLLTLSFNPLNDTPEVMREYGQGLSDSGLDWRFLTTASEQQLNPILEQYRQTVNKIVNEQGEFTGAFSHTLRVYLIDKNKHIRNIYSVSFLHPDTLINDLETLLAEAADSAQRVNHSNVDRRETNNETIAPEHASHHPIDLLQTINKPSLGLPAMPVPANNPVTRAKIRLGRKLFFDRRLSLNRTISCAMCHVPEQGFTSHEMKTAVGIEGRTVGRNSPTVYNVGYYQTLFHDGRESTLEQQAWGPLLARNEMANPSIGFVLDTIKSSADYDGLFEKAFSKPVGMETLGMALASYQRSLNSANSRFDQWKYGGKTAVLNQAEINGYQVFVGKGGCVNCHVISDDSALFTDNQFHNTGIGFSDAMQISQKQHRIQIAPGVFVEVDSSIVDSVSEQKANDLGRYAVTLDPHDRWKYKTPSLRNIALTGPYMHNGQFETLQQVVAFYNQGGIQNPELDVNIKTLHLTASEQADLVAFLHALTGNNVNRIIADALTAPVGDPH
ncbi:MAG TPA: photosynthetic protein synthase I [Crenotrichaceae bacterium]|nr:photosynthetic protein synthase I [Crenotrichaceae bacterium]